MAKTRLSRLSRARARVQARVGSAPVAHAPRGAVKRVAYLFLVAGEIATEPIWRTFFGTRAARERSSIYVHPPPGATHAAFLFNFLKTDKTQTRYVQSLTPKASASCQGGKGGNWEKNKRRDARVGACWGKKTRVRENKGNSRALVVSASWRFSSKW